MKPINLKLLNILRWILLVSILAQLCGIAYYDFKHQVFSKFLIAIVLFCSVAFILYQNYYTSLLVREGKLIRYGAISKFNMYSIPHFIFGIIFFILAVDDYSNHGRLGIKLAISIIWFLLGFFNINRFYIEINEKKISRYNFDDIKLADISSIEIHEHLVTLKSKKKSIEVHFVDLGIDNKESFLNDLERIKRNNNLT